MKRLVLIAVCVVLFTAGWAIGAQHRQDTPGMATPYTPSRLDWLALSLEASYRSEMSTADSTAISYLPQAPDTITILVQYTDRTPAGLVDSTAEVGKIFVKQEAARLGWSQWVKTDVQRKYIKLSKSE